MKKIVALVLSMVMALSLATVAFAGVGPTVYGLDENRNVNKNDNRGDTLENVKAVTSKDGDGYIAYYRYTDADGEESLLIPCNQAEAELAVYKNGKFVNWVFETEDEGDAYYAAIVKVQKATSAKPSCTVTQYLEDGYVDANGNFYVDGTNIAVNLDGTIIHVNKVTGDYDYVVAASHIFAKGTKNDKTGYDDVKCLICDGEFAATSDEAVATKNGYKVSTGFAYASADAENVYDANKYEGKYDFSWGQQYSNDYKFVWQLKSGSGDAADKTDKDSNVSVDSPKTFDAGIAVYAGLSLLSVAGTAVVIGKKKEF